MPAYQGVIGKERLLRGEVAEVERLKEQCNQYEGIHMRIDAQDELTRPAGETQNFLYYEDDKLVGYLTMYGSGPDERELTAMVHPSYRRRGIFRELLADAQKECTRQGVEQITLVIERISASGQACAKALGATYDFSEHAMRLRHLQERYAFDDRLILRPADQSDLDLLTTITAGSFDTPEAIVRGNTLRRLQSPKMQYYVATFGESDTGCEEPVGCLRLHLGEQEVGIYGFGVLPAYRKRGYGRQILEEAIRMIQAEDPKTIMLEVDTNNTPALQLYLSCGFEIETTYDYYHL